MSHTSTPPDTLDDHYIIYVLQLLRQLGCVLASLLCDHGVSWDAQEQRGIHKSTHARDFEQVSIFGGSRRFDEGCVPHGRGGIRESAHARDFVRVSIFHQHRSFNGGRVGLAAERRGLSVCSSSTEGTSACLQASDEASHDLGSEFRRARVCLDSSLPSNDAELGEEAVTNWTDQDSDDQKFFSCVTVRIGDRVINVECTKQDVIVLSAIPSESYTLITGEHGRVPSEDNETDLGTKYLERDRIERCMTKMGLMIVEAWAGEQLLVVSGTGVIIGRGLDGGSQLDDGCCVARHSWSGIA